MGNLGDRFKIRDIVARVSDRLDVHGPSLIVNGFCKVLGALRGDELGMDAETRKKDFELVVCAAVEVGGADDVVASYRQVCNGHELCRLA